MKCFYHEDKDAVATCQRCGKSLCKECASKHSPVYCDECYSIIVADSKNRAEQRKQAEIAESKSDLTKILIKGVIGAIIFGIMGGALVSENPNAGAGAFIFMVLVGFCFPFGWQLLYRIPFFYGRSYEHFVIAMVLNILKYLLACLFGIPAFIITIIPVAKRLANASK